MKLHVVSTRKGANGGPVAVCGRKDDFPEVRWDKYQDEYFDPITFAFVDREMVCGVCHDVLHRRHGQSKGPRPPLRPAVA